MKKRMKYLPENLYTVGIFLKDRKPILPFTLLAGIYHIHITLVLINVNGLNGDGLITILSVKFVFIQTLKVFIYTMSKDVHLD